MVDCSNTILDNSNMQNTLTRTQVLDRVRNGIQKFLMDEHCAYELATAIVLGDNTEPLYEWFNRYYATEVGYIVSKTNQDLQDWYNECHKNADEPDIRIVDDTSHAQLDSMDS